MHFSISTALIAFCGSLAAQVPYGDAILSNFTNALPMEGLLLVKRNGTATPVTGLALTARGSNDINSIQLDPVDDRVWIGGITASVGRVDTLKVSGSVVASFAAVANVGTGASISGIAFDANGNAVVSSGTLSSTGSGGLFRIDRKTGLSTRIVGGPTWTGLAGTCNCVCSDDAGNLYFGVTGSPATAYSLAPGPNGDYSGPVATVGTMNPASGTVSSVEFAPANGARPARLWWTTFGSAGTAVGYIPLPSGATVTVGPIGGNNAPNWADYDALVDDFWVATGGINPDTIYSMDHAGLPTQIAVVPPGGANGSPSAIDANDCPPAGVTIIPQYLPATGSIDLEIGTCCAPGRLAGVFIPGPNIVLFAGAVGADGRLSIKIPNLTVLRGAPNSVPLQGVCFNPANNQITLGNLARWPKN